MSINNSLPLTLPLNARPDIVDMQYFTTAPMTVGTAAADNLTYIVLPTLPDSVDWVLTDVNVVSSSTLAAHNTNYINFVIKNKSNSDADMLSTADVNSTKSTGGSGLTADTKRALTLNATDANKVANNGAVLQINAKGNGTLANAANHVTFTLTFTQYMNK